MTFKVMVIDDQPARKECYRKVLSQENFEPIFIWKRSDFEKHKETPVDGYLLDVFLEKGDWNGSNAAELLKNAIQSAPRPAPVFLISQFWGESRILDVLKQAGESSASVIQYLAWSEFEAACGNDTPAAERLGALQTKLFSELTRWHARSGFRPKPDDTIRILLLADPQFGDPKTDPKATFAENWIAKTLITNSRNPDGDPVPDLIVLAGDISYTGRPDQFALAEERLVHDLMAPLWGEHNIDRMRDQLIVVPGNHDVNLRFSAADGHCFNPSTKEFTHEHDQPILVNDENVPYPSHREYALEPFRRFAHRLTRQREWRDSKSMSWVDRRYVHCGIRFFTLNTVAELNAQSPSLARLSESPTRAISRSLADDMPDSIFSIAVSHHGLPTNGTNKRIIGVDNWSTVGRDFFSMHKIKLWLYGHGHEYNAYSLNGPPFDKEPLWMVQIPTTRILDTQRGFCVLELERKSGKVVNAFVNQYVFENGRTEKRDRRKVFGCG